MQLLTSFSITILILRSSDRLKHLIQILFLTFDSSNLRNEIKKNELIKARKLCTILIKILLMMVGNLKSVTVINIYPTELDLGKEKINKHEGSFLDWISKLGMESFKLAF